MAMDPRQRPLSPHLQVYQPQITSVLSILHRIAGIYMVSGVVALALWVMSLSSIQGDQVNCFGCMVSFYQSTFGQLLVVSWVTAFFYHLGNGIRHFFWDVGMGYEMPVVHKSGWFVVAFAAGMTALFCYVKMGAGSMVGHTMAMASSPAAFDMKTTNAGGSVHG